MTSFILSVIFLFTPPPEKVSGWKIFEQTAFEWKYVEELGLQVEIPTFDEKVKSLNGKEVILTGYYLPINIARKRIILSKLPMAACFFCGGNVGLESVAEIHFQTDHPRFKVDDLVTVKGKLILNDGKDGHLVFILENASVLTS